LGYVAGPHWLTGAHPKPNCRPPTFNIIIIIIERAVRRLRGHRTKSRKSFESAWDGTPKTRPKLSCRIASSEQFSLQVPLKRWHRWWRGHRGRQAVAVLFRCFCGW